MLLQCCVAALLVVPTAAFAQSAQGPFAGLFGRAPDPTGTEHTTFEVRGSGGLQWEGEALIDRENAPDSFSRSDQSGNALGIATFKRYTERLSVDARSGVQYRQSIAARPLGGTSFDAGVNATLRATTRLSVNGAAAYRYSPFFQFHPSFLTLETGQVMPGLPYLASSTPNTSTSVMGGVTSQYSKRAAFILSGERTETQLRGRPESDVSMVGANARWTYQLNRSLRLRLGYGRDQWRQASQAGVAFKQEIIEAGIDFSRTFSVWRRTSFGVRTESVILRRLDSGRYFRLNGNVSLSRRFVRTWEVTMSANRGSEFMAGFTEPVFSDYGNLSIAGQLSDRIASVTDVSAGRGQFGIDGGGFFTGSAATMVNVALTRRLGVFVQAGFYRWDVPVGISTVTAVNELSRRTVLVGLNTWIPLINRERGDR